MSENESDEDKPEQSQDEHTEPENDEQAREDKRENRRAWLRFILLNVAVFIPLAVGMGCLIGGTNHDNHTVALIGKYTLAAVPVVMAILVAAVLIWKFRGVRKSESDTTDTTDDKTAVADEAPSGEAKEETPSQREREQQAIAAVNSTEGFISRANLANYEAEHISEGMKHAPKWGLPVGLICFFSLITLLVAATVLLIKHIFVGAIVCATIFGVIIITAFIVMAVSRAKATNGDISKAKKITEGKVKACFMVGMAETRTLYGHGETVRIQGVTYQVIVTADGNEYRAFSKQFYETDENVTIAVMGKKRAKIVENAEPEKIET